MILYVSWQFLVYVCIYRAIKNQPLAEIENAVADLGPTTGAPAETSA
jgi:hypothetical protein